MTMTDGSSARSRSIGFFTTSVGAGDGQPSFTYTTGFWLTLKAPEIITFALKGGHDLAWNLFRDLKDGAVLPVGRPVANVLEDFSVYFFPMAERKYSGYLNWSRWFYNGTAFPCLQMVWPDKKGLFPWQDGFDEAFRGDQPDLTDNGWIASLPN